MGADVIAVNASSDSVYMISPSRKAITDAGYIYAVLSSEEEALFAASDPDGDGVAPLLVAAAGNGTNDSAFEGQDIGERYSWPGSLDLDNMITVGATQDNVALSALSNFSSTYVQIAAPGDDVRILVPEDYPGSSSVGLGTGTSFGASDRTPAGGRSGRNLSGLSLCIHDPLADRKQSDSNVPGEERAG
jgi:hypothetical protein